MKMKISILIPSYNEERTIQTLLERIDAVTLDKEIIIVDDSIDGTKKILIEEAKKHRNIRLIFPPAREGKGAAIRAGLPHVSGDIVIIQDADLEYDPQDYYRLIQPILAGETKVVYGSRFLDRRNRHKYSLNLFATKLLSTLANALYGSRLTDEPTGYKVFKADVVKDITLACKGFEFCPEITAKVLKKGYKIIEVPIRYTPRTKEEGKKVNWKDGVIAIWTLLKYRIRD